MHTYLKISSIAMLFLAVSTQAAVIFRDDFLNREYSVRNWTLISTDDNKLQFVDNKATIINGSQIYSALAVHLFEEDLPAFTFSANVASEYPGAGLYFCFDELRSGYRGYGALLGDDGIYLYKFYPESVSVIASRVSAFVKMGENRLAVSKNGEKIHIFCNGYFIFTITDDEFRSGGIAFIVPPGSEASFDDAVVENCIADTSRFDTFTDDFLEKSLFGWTRYGNALTDWTNSHLRIQTSQYQEFYNSIEIPLSCFNMKTVVQYNEGDSGSFYGFFIQMSNDTGSTPSFYHFAISADKKFVLGQKNQQAVAVPYHAITGNAAQSYDTLELNSDKNVLAFFANGAKLGEYTDVKGNVTGAGLYISNKLTVSFDNFQINDPGMKTSAGAPENRNIQMHIVKKNGVSTDLLGRVISKKYIPDLPGVFLKAGNSGNWEKRVKISR